MKRLITLFMVCMAALLTGCSREAVPAGYVGVMFDQYGGDKGVTGKIVGPGRYWLSMNEELYKFPTFSQNDSWVRGQGGDESISFQDKEGTIINADVGISFAVDPKKVDTIFQKYRKGINEITDIYIRNMVRDALNSETSTMVIDDIYAISKGRLVGRPRT